MGQGTVPCPNPNGTELTYGDKEYTWESGHNLKSIADVENEISIIVEKFTHELSFNYLVQTKRNP